MQRGRRSRDTKMARSPEKVRPNEIQEIGSVESGGMDYIIMGERAERVRDIRTDK